MHGLNRVFLLASVGILVLLVVACDKPLAVSPEDEERAEVHAAFSLPKLNASAALSKLVITVTGSGMDSLVKEVLVTDAGPVRTSFSVTAGKNRRFDVTAYHDSVAILAGRDSLDLVSGKRADLAMKLGFLVPALSLTPVDTTVTKTNTFTTYIVAHHVDSLCTIGAKLRFDPAKLKVTELGREDDFLKKNGGAVTQLQFSKDNTAGEVKLVLGIFPAAKSVSGEGRIARVVFQALDGPAADLTLSLDAAEDGDLGMYDKNANAMAAYALGSRIQIQ